MKVILFLSVLLVTGCTGKSASSNVSLHKASLESDYTKFINQSDLGKQEPNLTLDKTIVNNEYPIEIALYKNNKFFYNLPNLGTGKGSWKYKDGMIALRASRTIFDMYIEIYGADAEIKQVAIQFSDRFGPNTLKMDNSNI